MKKLMISLLVGLFEHGLALGVQFVDGDFAAYSIDDSSAVIWQYNGHDRHVMIPSGLTYSYVIYEYDDEGNYLPRAYTKNFRVVGVSCFARNRTIESVTIPEGVTNICEGAFIECTSLTKVVMPSSVRVVGDGAFESCTSLTKLTMPDGIRVIGLRAFYCCSNLTELNLPKCLEEIGEAAFWDSGLVDVRLPGCVRKVGAYAFERSKELRSVVFEEGFDAMSKEMFYSCEKLQTVKFPSSMTKIPELAFCGCYALTGLDIPKGLVSIGRFAFDSCEKIKKLEIPAGVVKIGDEAFSQCCSLSLITVSSANRHYKEGNNCLLTKDGKILIRAPANHMSVVVPDGVREIADGAFSGCRTLKSVILPLSVESIGQESFFDCLELASIDLPSRLRKIGVGAFCRCNKNNPWVIPESVLSIGCDVFMQCYGKAVFFEGKPPKFEDTEAPVRVGYPTHTLGGSKGVGCYRREFADEWEAVLDDNGYWHGLRMLPRDKGYLVKYEFKPTSDTDSLLGPSRSDFHLERASGRLCKAESDGGWREVASFKSGEPVDIIWGDGTYRVFFGYDNSEAFGEPIWVPFIECEDLTVPLSEDVSRIRYFYDRENYPLEKNGQPVKLMVYFNPGKNANCSPQVVELPESARGDYPFVLESGDIPTPNRPTEVDGDIVRTYRFRGWYDGDWLVKGSTAFARGRTFMLDGKVRDGVLLEAKWDVTEIDAQMRPGTGKWRWEDSTVEWTFDHSFENLMSVSSVTPKPTGYLQIPEEMAGERVASIGRYAFSDSLGLTSVSIPEGVQSIGVQAFSGCYDLTWIDFPSTLKTIEPYAFGWCLGLEYVEIPVGVTTIGEGAFTTCGCLETVVLPEGLTTIPSNVFNSCCSLRTVTIPSTVTKIEPTAFNACSNLGRVYVMPGDEERVSQLLSESGVDVSGSEFLGKTPEGLLIDHGLLIGFEGMMQPGEAVVVPDCVTGMVDYVFAGMPMGSVVIPSSVKRISDYAFASCRQLNVVTLAPSIETIGVGAFSCCTELRSIVLPAALQEIGHFAFEGCEALREIAVVGGNTRYYTVGGVLYDRQTESLVCCPGGFQGELQVPEGVKKIGYAACELCTGLQSVKLPSSVAGVGFGAFFSCTNLSSLVFDGNAPSVEERAFEGVPPNCTAIVRKGTSGWNVPIPGQWNGIRIVYAGDGDSPSVDPVESVVEPVVTNTITYVGIEGAANPNPATFTTNDLPLTLSPLTREGYTFLGWTPNNGVIPAETVTNVTFTANWEKMRPTNAPPRVVDEAETHVDVEKGEVAPFETAAAVYDGFLYEGEAVVGSVQVKVAKMKNGEAKVTATVQMAGQAKKLSFKGGVADATGKVTRMSVAGHQLDITVGVNGLGGTLDGKTVDGARNVFSGKSAADKDAASEAVRLYQGVYNVAFDGGALSVSVDKKGKAKIAGTVGGNKVSATSQLVVGKDAAVVPVVITKKVNVAFCLWVMANGTVEARGIEGAIADRPSTLKAGAKFGVDGAAGVRALLGLYGEYLPNGIDVAANGTKWIVAGGVKAGKVAFVKGGNTVDESKLGTNPSGLKLTYKQKDGTFKGSFKAYNLESNGKIKAYTANVTGVMIGAKGYGTATIKKPACTFLITIE